MESELENKSLVEELKDYRTKNNLTTDFDEDAKELKDFKEDYLKFSKYYIQFFNEFRKDFKNFKEAEKTIKDNLPIVAQLISLTFDYNDGKSFCSVRVKEEIKDYVKSKYYNILDFINLYIEVYK